MPSNDGMELFHSRGAAVLPGTFTTAFMYPEKRLAIQIEKRVRALAKPLQVPIGQSNPTMHTAPQPPPSLKVEKRPSRPHSTSASTGGLSRPQSAPQIGRGKSQQEQEQFAVMYRAHALREKHLAADVRAKQSKMIRRLEAKKRSKVRELRTELAWARVEEDEIEKEEERRALDVKLAEKFEQLRIQEIEKDLRLRKVQQREKNAMTDMHKFYPLLAEAKYYGSYDKLWKTLDTYMDRQFSEPVKHIARPQSAPGSRTGSVTGSRGERDRERNSFVSQAYSEVG